MPHPYNISKFNKTFRSQFCRVEAEGAEDRHQPFRFSLLSVDPDILIQCRARIAVKSNCISSNLQITIAVDGQ